MLADQRFASLRSISYAPLAAGDASLSCQARRHRSAEGNERHNRRRWPRLLFSSRGDRERSAAAPRRARIFTGGSASGACRSVGMSWHTAPDRCRSKSHARLSSADSAKAWLRSSRHPVVSAAPRPGPRRRCSAAAGGAGLLAACRSPRAIPSHCDSPITAGYGCSPVYRSPSTRHAVVRRRSAKPLHEPRWAIPQSKPRAAAARGHGYDIMVPRHHRTLTAGVLRHDVSPRV